MGIYTDAVANKEIYYNPGAVEVDTSYKLGDGNHKVKISGSGTNISLGKGSSTVQHYGENAVILAGDGYKKITSTGSDKTIVTGNGNDYVSSIGDNVAIDVGNGNNTVKSVGDNCDIKTGSGNDSLVYVGDFVKADTGAGDDRLVFWGNYGMVSMGEGNDSATTLDQVYTEDEYADLADDFLGSLETGISEKWTLTKSTLIDTHRKKSFCKTKTTYTFENTYQVDTIFSRYINGVKGTNIDMGSGSDTANVTLAKNSKVTSTDKEDEVTKNKKWQIDEVIDTRTETKIKKKTKTKNGWSAIGQMIGGAVLLVASVFVGMVCVPAAIGVACAGYGMLANGAREGSVHGGTGGQ